MLRASKKDQVMQKLWVIFQAKLLLCINELHLLFRLQILVRRKSS